MCAPQRYDGTLCRQRGLLRTTWHPPRRLGGLAGSLSPRRHGGCLVRGLGQYRTLSRVRWGIGPRRYGQVPGLGQNPNLHLEILTRFFHPACTCSPPAVQVLAPYSQPLPTGACSICQSRHAPAGPTFLLLKLNHKKVILTKSLVGIFLLKKILDKIKKISYTYAQPISAYLFFFFGGKKWEN